MACGTITPIGKPLQLGESPHWDPIRGKLLYADMSAGMVHCYCPISGDHYEAKVGTVFKWVTMILPVEGSKDEFVLAVDGDLVIAKWDCMSPQITEIEKYIELEPATDVRINDGKASPSGVILAGSMAYKLPNGTVPAGKGNLFAIDNRSGKPVSKNLLPGKVDLSNGLCWSPDETIFYWADTLQRKVYKFDYDKENITISNQRVLLDYEKENLKGNPDGMTVDVCGSIFLASVDGGGELLRVDSNTGEVMDHIEFPKVSDIASCAFGGKNLEDLYVTTIHRDDEPLSGSLFVLKGLGTSGYAGTPAKLHRK